MLSFGCYRRKKVYLLNVWRPIVHVLFHWPHPRLCRRVCMDRLYKRFKFQLNRMKNSRVIRGQSFRHSLPTLECKFEPNVTFTDRDETGARRKVWTNDSPGPSAQKFLSPIFRVMAPYNWYLLMFGTDMYLPMTYKLYKMRACLLRTYGVIKVFTFSRPKFHRVQCKLEDPFSAGRLASSPLTTLYVCRY